VEQALEQALELAQVVALVLGTVEAQQAQVLAPQTQLVQQKGYRLVRAAGLGLVLERKQTLAQVLM
jgi:hypothetical protein